MAEAERELGWKQHRLAMERQHSDLYMDKHMGLFRLAVEKDDGIAVAQVYVYDASYCLQPTTLRVLCHS